MIIPYKEASLQKQSVRKICKIADWMLWHKGSYIRFDYLEKYDDIAIYYQGKRNMELSRLLRFEFYDLLRRIFEKTETSWNYCIRKIDIKKYKKFKEKYIKWIK